MSAPETPRGLARVVVRGASLAAVGLALSQGLNFVFYLILARLVTPQDFGVMAAGAIVVGIGMIVAESGMVSALIQRDEDVEEAANTALVATMAAGIGFSLVALAVSPLIGMFFESRETTLVAAAMSGFLTLRAATLVPDGIMRRRFSFGRRLVVEPASMLAFGIVALWLCARGYGVWGLVLGQYASVLASLVLSWALGGWRPNLRLASFAMWRQMAGFGRHLIFADLVLRVTAEIPTAIVGRFVGTAGLGQYRYGFRFASQPFAFVLNTASYVLFPALSRITHDPERFRSAFRRSLRWISVIAFPMGLVFLPLGEPLLAVLLGEEWRPAGYALVAMAGYTSARAFDSLATEAVTAWGRPKIVARMHVLGFVLTLALMLGLLPFGLVGVAAGLSLAAIGVAVYAMSAVCRVIGLALRAALAEIWPPAVAGLVMLAVLFPLEHLLVHAADHGTTLGIALLALDGIVGAVSYLAALVLLRPQLAQELLAARGTLISRLRRRPAPPAVAD